MKLSVSQLKTYNASPAKWAGFYILWIKEKIENDALWLWQIAENWLVTGQDDYSILENANIQDMEKTIEQYDIIKHNAKWLEIPKWVAQYKTEWVLLWQMWVWYIDIITEDEVIDIKTSQYLTNPETTSPNMWSWLSSYDEYALQLWVYMKLTGRSRGKIIEVSKHKYKDERNSNQILEFVMSDEWDKAMTDKRQPIVDEMVALYNKHK